MSLVVASLFHSTCGCGQLLARSSRSPNGSSYFLFREANGDTRAIPPSSGVACGCVVHAVSSVSEGIVCASWVRFSLCIMPPSFQRSLREDRSNRWRLPPRGKLLRPPSKSSSCMSDNSRTSPFTTPFLHASGSTDTSQTSPSSTREPRLCFVSAGFGVDGWSGRTSSLPTPLLHKCGSTETAPARFCSIPLRAQTCCC